MSNWLIGREIVEEEQRGKKRAGYGKPLLKGLSEKLQADFGKGYSVDNMELFRCFYRISRPDFRGGAPEIKRGSTSIESITLLSQVNGVNPFVDLDLFSFFSANLLPP